ncbi:MAG: flagellar basal body protein FliL [Spirochaetaceae bacterium]|jgi:flagellar basal body-associated protein FliL|nr:flagellar basal body protein FliL [Spirochaetaceae bacterium]
MKLQYRKREKPVFDTSAKASVFISRALLIVLALLILVLAAGTLYALVFRAPDAPPLYSFTQEQTQETALIPELQSPTPIFTGIGTIRTTTADKEPATVILSISFPYKPQDITFTEELNLTIARFRTVTQEYISSFTAEKLRIQAEETVKSDLLDRYNALLRLGKIDLLYFEDFMIIE